MSVLKLREQRLLEILMKFATVKDAMPTIQHELKLSDRAVYNILYRMRQKQVEARNYVNLMLSYRNHNPLLRDRLRPRITPKILNQEISSNDEEEEEEQ